MGNARFIHTSDWHLGRIFHGKSLISEQHALLEDLLEKIRETEVDAVVIAGDVYDRAIPPVEAIALLDWFVSETVLGLNVPLLLVAGNHDSAERLCFGARLLNQRGLRVVGGLGHAADPLILGDVHGEVRIYGLPYADPPQMRDWCPNDAIEDHESGMRAAVGHLLKNHPREARAVLVAHAFVAGGLTSDSERPLSVAGAGTVPSDVFSAFAYTALGHLHRPQAVGSSKVQYSGSLLRYSFSELGHDKSINLVEIGGREEEVRVERLPLVPPRQLRQIRGTLQALLEAAVHDKCPEDLLLVSLEDDGPVLDPLGKLRAFYPNVLHVERRQLLSAAGEGARAPARRQNQSERDLFAAFFQEVTGEALSDEQSRALGRLLETWQSCDRQELSL